MPSNIRPKRKGFIWASFIFCIAELIIGLAVLVLAVYNLASKKRNIDVPIISKWRTVMGQLVGLSGGLIFVSLLGMWIVSRARQKNRVSAAFIILVHILAFLGSIYFTVTLYAYYDEPSLSPDEIFIHAGKTIHETSVEKADPRWIPTWLDAIQEKSEICCGIRTYRDWEIFWDPLKNEVPRSCCLKSRKDCQPNFNKLIYPDLPAKNIKLEDGCHAEINEKIKSLIMESRKFCLALAIILGFSLILLCALFIVVFFLKKSRIIDDDWEEDDESSVYQAPSRPAKPVFLPEDQNWKTLDFYRVKTRRRLFFNRQTTAAANANDPGLLSVSGSVQPLGSQRASGVGTSGIQLMSQPGSSSGPLPPQVQYKLESLPQQQQQSASAQPTKDPEQSSLTDPTDDQDQRRPRHHIRGFMRRSRRRRRNRNGAGSDDDPNQAGPDFPENP